MKKLFILLLVIGILQLAAIVSADEPTLAWDAPATGVVKGYTVYYGTVEGEFPFHDNVGNVLSVPDMITFFGLHSMTKYWFAVTAYNDGGESGKSNIVSLTTPSYYVPYAPPDPNKPEPEVPPAVIEVPDSVKQLILNFN